MSFFLYPGNKLETLAGICCRLIGDDPGSDPMMPETVVVQTQGMAVYLRQFFARRNGVAANFQMPFPAGFVSGILKQNIDGYDDAAKYFSQDQLALEIFSIFQHEADEFPELAGYISCSSDAILKTWQLANRTAVLFDRYQIYRYKDKYFPLKNDEWQSRLWKKLLKKYGKSKMQCCREFLELDRPIKGLPERLTVFGVGSLPPLYLDIFFKISESVDLRFFYMTPCREFWENLYSAKERKWRCNDKEIPEFGNPLLASWGAAGRELFANLLSHQDDVPYVSSEELLFENYFENASEASTLQQLQQDILCMHDARGDEAAVKNDDSIEIFNCHAPKREVEVLHDKLLTLFSKQVVTPGDVIVMAPNINTYLPYIDAVFGCGPLRNCYTVSDRNLRSSGGVSSVFRRLFELPNSRMEVDDVLGILNNAFVCQSRGITLNEIPVISRWIQKSGIRWGVDAADHARHCEVAFEEYSWMSGMDKMFELFARGCTPEEELAGFKTELTESDLELFGRFNRFLQELAELRSKFSRHYTLSNWMTLLLDILSNFFCNVDKETGREIASLRRFFNEQKALGEELAPDAEVSCAVIVDMLDGFLNTAQDRFSFLRGRITFCSLTPLRSVPADVIAVLGLDEGAFPRQDVELGFDLMSASLLPGDRSGAKEDRYLFLEALMSARKHFWCFYNGRSRRNGKKLESSVLLAEFGEYLQQCYNIEEKKQFLHGFDARYYSNEAGSVSWSQENFRVAQLLNGERTKPGSRIGGFDALPSGEFRHCVLDDLISWASHPVEYVLKNDLNVTLKKSEEHAAAETISGCGGLERYNLRSVISNFDRDPSFDEAAYQQELYQIMKGGNKLPPGESGRMAFEKELELIRSLDKKFRQEFYAQERLALSFEADLDDEANKTVISGMFECSPDLSSQKIIVCSKLRFKYYVNALMRHLALCMISDAPEVKTTLHYLEGKWQTCSWSRIDHPEDFWKKFMQMRVTFDKRIPAVFPETLFSMGKIATIEGKEKFLEKLTSECRTERDGNPFSSKMPDPVLVRCFAPDCMDDPELRDEFSSFEKLFFSGELLWQKEK